MPPPRAIPVKREVSVNAEAGPSWPTKVYKGNADTSVDRRKNGPVMDDDGEVEITGSSIGSMYIQLTRPFAWTIADG